MNNAELTSIAVNIRALTLDAIWAAQSGHPGLPLGCAELGALLYGNVLKHFPGDPGWIDRDRFILSAGHGSILQYILLHFSGYDLTIEDIKNFRQLGSKTPGHPEYGMTPGIETTTGILGQGIATAVGFAIAEKNLADRFNTGKHRIIDHFTYVLVGEGDLMEGISYESCSLAGHLGLGKLIVFYDANYVTIDGRIDLTFSENVMGRFESMGWQTLSGNMYDLDGTQRLIDEARRDSERPTLILLESVIGKSVSGYEGTSAAHGSLFRKEEIDAAKEGLGFGDDEPFTVRPEIMTWFAEAQARNRKTYEGWKTGFEEWSEENPGLFDLWKTCFDFDGTLPSTYTPPRFNPGDPVPTRVAGGRILDALMTALPNLIGGSGDLTVPNYAKTENRKSVSADNPSGNYIHYGIREHAMGAITNGLALHGGFRAYCGTFMAFSDYMRPAIRLAAIMKLPVVFVLTHDTILIGADGPTHQPVEFFATLEAIPGLAVIRPADAEETEAAWRMALARNDGPTVLALTRQDVTVFEKPDSRWRDGMEKGAYIVRGSQDAPDVTIVATGSEVALALEAAERISDLRIRVVSMPSRKLFFAQDSGFRDELVPPDRPCVVVEAGVSFGWDKLYARNQAIVSIESFGKSGPGKEVAEALGINTDAVMQAVRASIASR